MRWLGAVTIFIAIMTGTVGAAEQPQVKVQGTLKGYFLASDGTLDVYEVPFATDNASSADLPSQLYPLWAGYYLQATIHSSKPFQSLWLLSGSGRLLWRRHYPEGTKEASIPHQDGWLGLKGQDGLSVRLLVRFVDGKEQLFPCQFPCRFERVLPLKVDWLDFIRIAEVAHLLKGKGKEIWEGFTLRGIPFLLEGEEGQWVLINHPKPPKGFVRYEGPLPKVPFKMTVHVGEREKANERREELGGWLEKVNGVWTAALRYFPHWWVLQDCEPPGYTVTRQPDALDRLETIVHEAFHVWWFERVKEPRTEGRAKKAQAIVVEMAERECLARALEAEKGEGKRLWAKAFLKQRKRRRVLEGANEAEVNAERWKEMVEGTATFVGWKAMQAGQAEDYQPLPALEADIAFLGYQKSLDKQDVINSVRSKGGSLEPPYAVGLAQILLLSEWEGDSWQRKVVKGKDLEALLAEKVGDVTVDPSLISEVEKSARETFQQALERTRGRPEEAKPPEPHITIWLSLPVEVVHLVKEIERSFGNPLTGLCFSLSDMGIQIQPPVWVTVDESNKRVGILWDVNKQLMVLHRPDGTAELQGEGLKVQGKIGVTWDENGVHVRPADEAQKTMKGASKIVRKKGWYAVVLPVTLLAAIASRDTKALQEHETIAMGGTITGVFLNATTYQFEMVTLPVPSSEEDYYYADEEEYILQATFIPSWDPSNPTTQDFVITACASPDEPKMMWNFKPSGQLLVKVYQLTENEEDPHNPTISPFRDVQVEAYLWSEKRKRWEYKAKVECYGNSEALFPELAPGHYQLRGYKTRDIPACPMATEEITVFEGHQNIASMYFYLHKGIKGRVMEFRSDWRAFPLPRAQVYLFKGDQQLSGPWESDDDGYFLIPPFEIDAILAQHGSGTYTVKVIPPARSTIMPVPKEETKNVNLTKCERLKPLDECPRALTVDAGIFHFRYEYEPTFSSLGGR